MGKQKETRHQKLSGSQLGWQFNSYLIEKVSKKN